MGATQALSDTIDRVIDYFNTRKMDLPDGFFDRRAQFVVNGAPFETLLGREPDDPLVLMLARGPAGYRFTMKALQYAMPDATVSRASAPASIERGVAVELRIQGTLRDSSQVVDAPVNVTLVLSSTGAVEVAEASIDEPTLAGIRHARLSA